MTIALKTTKRRFGNQTKFLVMNRQMVDPEPMRLADAEAEFPYS